METKYVIRFKLHYALKALDVKKWTNEYTDIGSEDLRVKNLEGNWQRDKLATVTSQYESFQNQNIFAFVKKLEM